MMGIWMQQHADIAPQIAGNFFEANRRFFRTVALYLVHRSSDRELYQRLQDRYLETPEGSCSLATAYSLSYCYLMVGKMEEWIKLLNAKLEDETLVGERRVNWLVAAAEAEEIQHSPGSRHGVPNTSTLAGLGWLTKATPHGRERFHSR